MMNTKKIISVSSALVIAGAITLSSVSALSMESSDESTTTSSTSTESSDGDTTVSSETSTPAVESTSMGDAGKAMDPYNQCLAYVKLKGLTGVDCKAKAAAMRQENKEGRAQMNQGIKEDRMEMNQGIKEDRMEMQKENKQNRQMTNNGMNKPPMATGELKNFLRNPLTAEEQEAFKALLKAQQAEREAIMKDTVLTPEEKAVKMQELMTVHMTAILAYVNTEKQEAFKKMMEDKMAMMKKNQENRQEFKDETKEKRQEFRDTTKEKRQEFKEGVKAKKQALSEKNKALLTKAVESLSLERLQAILVKVEKALSISKKEKVLAQLNEIAEIIQDKIDALTGTSSEDSILGDILGTDVPASTTTETPASTVTQ